MGIPSGVTKDERMMPIGCSDRVMELLSYGSTMGRALLQISGDGLANQFADCGRTGKRTLSTLTCAAGAAHARRCPTCGSSSSHAFQHRDNVARSRLLDVLNGVPVASV